MNKRILIIDDEPDFRSILKKRLIASRFEVVEAFNGDSGLEAARSQKPDLIVLDVMMPGKDGIEVYRELRSDPGMRAIPVIFLTALANGGGVSQQSLDLMAQSKHGVSLEGEYMIFGKPYHPQDLVNQIRTMLSEGQAT